MIEKNSIGKWAEKRGMYIYRGICKGIKETGNAGQVCSSDQWV